MDPKQKAIFIACGAASGLIIVALAALLFLQIGAMNEACQARDDASDQLSGYYAAPVYPSDANRDARKADTELLNAWGDAAHALLTQGIDVPQGESPSQFVNRLSETIRALNARQGQQADAVAKAVAEGQEGVLDYSFGRYVTQGEMPKETDVPRLATQFAVIEHVCELLLEYGAQQILEVSREPFDAAQAQPAQEETRTSRNSRRRGRAQAEAPKAAAGSVAVDPALAKDGVTCESYTIRFRARYATLAKVLNAFQQDPLFMVVTDLSVAGRAPVKERVSEMIKTRQNARTAALRRSARARKDEAAAAQTEAEAEKPLFEGVSPSGRLVTDPANAIPLEVKLSFEVYSAPPPPASEAEAEQEGKN